MIATSLQDVLDSAKRKDRIILCGPGASGKDHVRKVLENNGYLFQISFTTRPKRSGEMDGKDYVFISDMQFDLLIEYDFFYEHVEFNGWKYGRSKTQIDQKNGLFIMTPSGLSYMTQEDRSRSLVVYFDIPEETRKERLVLRADFDSVERRLTADKKDFENFSNFDLKITNPNFK